MVGRRVCLRSWRFCGTVEDGQQGGDALTLKTPKPPQRGAAARATDQSLSTVDPVRTSPPNQAVFARFEPRGRFACPPLQTAYFHTPQESHARISADRGNRRRYTEAGQTAPSHQLLERFPRRAGQGANPASQRGGLGTLYQRGRPPIPRTPATSRLNLRAYSVPSP